LEVDNVPLNYDTRDFTTVVTALEGSDCPGATVATTNASNGKLVVYLHRLDGSFRQCAFNFMTIKNK
jgi:hypothetical protein